MQTQQQIQSEYSNPRFVHFRNYGPLPYYPAEFATPFFGTMRIKSLPSEFHSPYNVAILMEYVLQIGKVMQIEMLEEGAIVFFSYWHSNNNTMELYRQISTLHTTETLMDSECPGISKWIEIYADFPLFESKPGFDPIHSIEVTPFQPNYPISPMPPPPHPTLPIQEGEWTGLYIPMIPTDMLLHGIDFKSSDLQDFIENKIQIGKVRRIDLVDRDDLLNFDDETNPIQAAFIHMECWYDNYNTHILRSTLNTKGELRQRGYHDGRQMIKFSGKVAQCDTYSRYFVFKINHKPIPDADGKLNIHQLAALKTKHEAELEEARKEIEVLRAELDLLKNGHPTTPVHMGPTEESLYHAFSKSSFD